MKMRKLCLPVLLVLLLLPYTAMAAEHYAFSETAYPGLHGRKIGIAYYRKRTGAQGTLLLIDEKGNVLGQRKLSGREETGAFQITVGEEMPPGQTLQLVLEKDGVRTLQDECLLAADVPGRGCLRKVETAEKRIAITFDTTANLSKLPQLLDTLDALNIRCTFFLQGGIVKEHREWIEEAYAKGHELANHSMQHPNMINANNTTIRRELTGCNELITSVTGKPVALYRPPAGNTTYRDRAISRALGCEAVLWTFDSKDGFAKSTEQDILKTMYKKSEPGAIILMHIYGIHTIDVLMEYVPAMQAQGYEFVTVSDLMLPGGVTDDQGVMRLPAANE